MQIKFFEKISTSNWFIGNFSQSKGHNKGDNLHR